MNTYLIHIQYLGFRFHGWQEQPGVKTVEAMVKKTLAFILGHQRFKVLGTSRTDAMVSASHTAFELFVDQEMEREDLLTELNRNLPPDIRALEIETVGPKFNIISSPKTKTYHYYFCHGEKAHPFCAPFLASFTDALDIEMMKTGAKMFEGSHDFRRYCTKPKPDTQFEREILTSRIKENQDFTASFFPEQTWVFQIRSKGFMRHQVRLIMGQLLCLGRGETDLDRIRASLTGESGRPFSCISPASGLMLQEVGFGPVPLEEKR